MSTDQLKEQFFETKIDSINQKIPKITKLAKTVPYFAYYMYNALVKHDLIYRQRIGINVEMNKKTSNKLRIFAKRMVGQSIKDKNTLSKTSNTTRYSVLAINTSHLVENQENCT